MILDLGAGSGILGIELARNISCEAVTFVELQDEFRTYLESNCQKFLPKNINFEIIIKSFSEFNTANEFDLIVCNPPYYLPGRGELPEDRNRSLARTFLTDSWPALLNKISHVLSPSGKAYIILKNDLKLYNIIKNKSAICNLEIEKKVLHSLMILELFRLNKD